MKILVYDKSVLVKSYLKKNILHLVGGAEIVEANDMLEVAGLAKNDTYDMIILDIDNQQKEFVSLIRQLENYQPNGHVVIFTHTLCHTLRLYFAGNPVFHVYDQVIEFERFLSEAAIFLATSSTESNQMVG